MPTYDVHLYREMRLKFENIEAASPEDAVRRCCDVDCVMDGPAVYDGHRIDVDVFDCDGRDLAATVDVVGDTEYGKTKDFELPLPGDDPEVDTNRRLSAAAPDLLRACELALLIHDTLSGCESVRKFAQEQNFFPFFDPGQALVVRAAVAKAKGQPINGK